MVQVSTTRSANFCTADDKVPSCTSPSQDAAQDAHDADDPFCRGLSPQETTQELPELCQDDLADAQHANHLPSLTSSTLATASSEPHLAASPARPEYESSVIKEQRRRRKIFTSRPYRRGSAEATAQSKTRSYPDDRRGGMNSTANYGQDGDEQAQKRPSSGPTLVEHPLRKILTKRSAPQGHSMPATGNLEGEATVASKHPRLVSAVLFHLKQRLWSSDLEAHRP